MERSFTLQQPLQSIFWLGNIKAQARHCIMIVAGVLLLTQASKIKIPLVMVPITLQTLALFFIGMSYGWRLGTLTLLCYLALGALGVPVFTGSSSGFAAFTGPAGGYLIGYIPAILLSSYLIENGWGKQFSTVICAQVIAIFIIYSLGLMVLHSYVGWHHVLAIGLYPFIALESLKIIFLGLLIPRLWILPKPLPRPRVTYIK